MQLSAIFALIAAATVVFAETNAQRLARGLSPNAPGKRATPVERVARHHPSNTPGGDCNTGPAHCCNSLQTTGNGDECDDILKSLGLNLGIGIPVGLSCSPILGTGADCEQQPVCCEDNSFNGLINVGCSPINIL